MPDLIFSTLKPGDTLVMRGGLATVVSVVYNEANDYTQIHFSPEFETNASSYWYKDGRGVVIGGWTKLEDILDIRRKEPKPDLLDDIQAGDTVTLACGADVEIEKVTTFDYDFYVKLKLKGSNRGVPYNADGTYAGDNYSGCNLINIVAVKREPRLFKVEDLKLGMAFKYRGRTWVYAYKSLDWYTFRDFTKMSGSINSHEGFGLYHFLGGKLVRSPEHDVVLG